MGETLVGSASDHEAGPGDRLRDWWRFVPLLCTLGLLALSIAAAVGTVGSWRNHSPESGWTVMQILALQYGGVTMLAVVLGFVLLGAVASARPPLHLYRLGGLYAAAAFVANGAGVIAKWADHSRQLLRGGSWEITIQFAVTAVFALAVLIATVLVMTAAQQRQPS